LQISVRGPRSFGKNERAFARAQNSNQRLERTPIIAFQIYRDHIQLWQKPAEDRNIHQRFFCEKENRPVGRVAGEWRIEKTLVIHRKNHGTGLNHALAMNDTKSIEQTREQATEMIAEPIVKIHSLSSLRNLFVLCAR